MSWIEIAGFVFGVIGVVLTLVENVWCFPVGIANVILSLLLFFQQRLYADALQQVVYIILLSYGWIAWVTGDAGHRKLIITTSGISLLGLCASACLLCTVLLGSLLSAYTDASFPWLDSFATSLSFVAQWMIARKKIENWLIWILVNFLYIGIYIYKHLPLYACLFFIYLVLAISGYITWRKNMSIKTENAAT